MMAIGKNKRGEHFQFALIAILLSVFISVIAFMTESNKITGFAISGSSNDVAKPELRDMHNMDDLRSLSKGNYYIDSEGVVYWLDDESKPAIAKVDYIRDEQKNRQIYIDDEGNIGYVIK